MSLIHAARHGSLSEVRRLISHRQDQNNRALIEAARWGQLPIIEFLVGKGADPRAQNDRALFEGAKYGYIQIIRYLLVLGADINVLSRTFQNTYRYLVPKVISIQEYYRLEPFIDKVDLSSSNDRYILWTTNKVYVLPK